MGVDREMLRRLAEKAEPGPWTFDLGKNPNLTVYYIVAASQNGAPNRGRIARMWKWGRDWTMGNTEYIAAADPTTVLELLDELDKQAAVIRKLFKGEASR